MKEKKRAMRVAAYDSFDGRTDIVVRDFFSDGTSEVVKHIVLDKEIEPRDGWLELPLPNA